MVSWALLGLTALFLGWFAVSCLQNATKTIDPYDGSYNAMVARTMAFQHAYGVWDNGRFIPCPVAVTTGPTMLLPIAAAYAAVGDWPFLPGVVATFLCLGVLSLAIGICFQRAADESPWQVLSLSFAVVVLLTITAKTANHALFWAILGDALAGLYLLAATVSIGRVFRDGRSPFWAILSGGLAAAAFNTKFLSALPLAALAAFLLVSVILRWMPPGGFVAWLLALVGTQLCFEWFTICQLGSFSAYIDHWREFAALFARAGSGLAGAKPPILQLVSHHMTTLFSEFGWCVPVLLVPLIAAAWCLYDLAWGKGSADAWIGAACAVQILPTLFWWLGYCNFTVFRHVAPAFVLLPFYCHFVLCALGKTLHPKAGLPAMVVIWIASIGVGCALSPAPVWLPPALASGPHARSVDLMDFANEITKLQKEHTDARFWGAGWWRHWDVQLVTHVSCLNLLEPPVGIGPGEGPHDYLIVSDFFDSNHPVTRAALDKGRSSVVLARGCFLLHQLKPPLASTCMLSASHTNPGVANDRIDALLDGVTPSSSSDPFIPRFTWWDHQGTVEWVQCDFKEPRPVSAVELYWFDDTGSGACRIPHSWRLFVREGSTWKIVESASPLGTKANQFNRVGLEPITATGLRVEVQLQSGFSAGILEWNVE